MKYYVGIDLGGTNIAAGVVDETGKIICKYSRKTNIHQPFEDLVRDIAETGKEVVRQAGMTMEDITSVGMGSPSCINPKNNLLVFANNLGWSNVPLPAVLQSHFDVPVYVRNDADCAALGEVIAGAARNYENAIMITLGTGVGGGVILNRRIFSGCDHMGGELGHTKLIYHGVRCTCGQYGCLESYTSATALIRETKEAMAEHPESLLHQLVDGDLSRVEAKTVFDAAHQNDETALAVVDQYIDYLAAGLSSFVSIFRPDVLIIGGGISWQGDYLLDPLNEKLKGYIFSYREIGGPKAIRAELGNDAGIIGAAMLELSEEE